jgi:hypothetical protein
MVQIPQIYRRSLASSVVGTPGVDTSGLQEAQAGEKLGGQAAGTLFNAAIEKRNLMDQAEKNTLSAQAEMNTFKTLEQMKVQYADQPEKVTEMLLPMMKENLEAVQNQASNPRVKLALGVSDPYFNRAMILNQQRWEFSQREALDKNKLINGPGGLNDTFNTAEQIGSSDKPYIEKLQDLTTLHSIGGKLVAGAFAAAHPESAAELETRFSPTVMTRAFYGMLRNNPAQANQFLQEPTVQEAFRTNPKELDGLQEIATKRLEGAAKQAQWNQISKPLIDSPQVFDMIAKRDVDWNMIDKFPDGQLKTELQKMALQLYPQENGEQRDQAMAKFFADAADMHIKSGFIPKEKTVSDLVNFNTEITKAFNDGFISPADHRMMLTKLAIPLRDAVLRAHDPEQAEAVKKQGGFFGLFGSKEAPKEAMDKYVGGYNVINNWMKSQGKDQDWQAKTDAIEKYIQLSDQTKAEDRDSQGRPFTPSAIAQKALGIAIGDSISTKYGLKKITGHDKNGMPIVEISKEEQDDLDRQKVLKAMKGK